MKKGIVFHIVPLMVVLVLVVGLLPVSAAGSNTITLTASWPVLNYTVFDDPDEPFESFIAQYHSSQATTQWVTFWEDGSNSECVVPDYCLKYNYSFRIVGYTASDVYYSNSVVYNVYEPFPDIRVDYQMPGVGLFWDTPVVNDFSSAYLDVSYTTHEGSSTSVPVQVIYNGSWVRSGLDNLSQYLAYWSPSSGFAGAVLNCRFRGITGNGSVLYGNQRSVTVPSIGDQITYHSEDFAIIFDSYNDVFMNDSLSGFNRNLEIRHYDDDSLVLMFNNFSLPRQSLKTVLAQNNQLGAGGILLRTVKVRLVLSYQQSTYNGPWVFINGIDGLGNQGTIPADTALYTPSDTEIADAVDLLYSGVSQTRVYRYALSAVPFMLPLAGLVFLINKVH